MIDGVEAVSAKDCNAVGEEITTRDVFLVADAPPASVTVTVTLKRPAAVGTQVSAAVFALEHPLGNPE